MPFTTVDMTPKFEAEIVEILRRVLYHDTLRSGCGEHCIERRNDGSILLSNRTARFLLRRLESEK